MNDDDLIGRLGRELGEAAERQAAGRRGPMTWLRRRSGRTLLLAGGVTVALAGVGGAAGLLAGRGEVGGPPTLTYARLTPEQRAAGLSETTRPVVIGRGRGRHSGWAWQLVAFQTTSGLCIAIDFPAIENIGGGCAVDVPREGRPIDWQGNLSRLGGQGPTTLLGAVRPDAARVTLAHGYRDRRVAEEARMVRVSDPQILDAIGVPRPFALWVGETVHPFPMARAVAYDGAGRELGAVGVPNGGAGDGGFLPRGCELPRFEDARITDTTLPLTPALRRDLGAFVRNQRAGDRPEWLVRRLLGRERRPDGRFSTPFLTGGANSEIDLGALRRTGGTAPDGRPLFLVVYRHEFPRAPEDCLRTATPRLQREAARLERARLRANREVHVLLVDSQLVMWGGATSSRPRGGWGYRGSRRHRYVHSLVRDGVATVELTFRNGLRRTARVSGNLVAVDVPLRASQAWVDREVWRDAAGRVVWRGRR